MQPTRTRSAATGRRIGMFAIAASIMIGLPSCAVAPSSHEVSTVSIALRAATQELLDAIAPGDVAVWDHWLDPAVIQVDENAVVRDKSTILADLQPLGAGLIGHLKISDFRMSLVGDVAVVTHEDDETLDYHGQMLSSRFRMTDTWHRTAQGWRLLGTQVLAVQQDPPAVTLNVDALCAYAGRYALTSAIEVTARCEMGHLVFERPGRPARQFIAELKDQFFEPGQPRTRRVFLRDPEGAITGFVDRREGRDIFWRRRPQS